MANSNWQPKWWQPENPGSKWDHVKEAIKRDWEQTKRDFHVRGRDLNQPENDTSSRPQGRT